MSFPFSLYRGLYAPQPNSPIDRRDLLDYAGSNTVESARYINPLTHDFEVSSTNLLQGMNAVEQEVMLAVNTTFNSSALPGFGQNFGSIKLITPNIKNQINSALRQCLSNLLDSGQITLGNINISNTITGQVNIKFDFINTTLGTTSPISFLLQ